MDPLRIPLDTPVETRNFNVSKDAMLTNCLVDITSTDKKVVGRPGLDLKVSGLGAGNGIFYYDGQTFTAQTASGPAPSANPNNTTNTSLSLDNKVIVNSAGTLGCIGTLYSSTPGYTSIITFDGTNVTKYEIGNGHKLVPFIFSGGKFWFQNRDGTPGQTFTFYHTTDFTTFTQIPSVTPQSPLVRNLISDGVTISTGPPQVNYTTDFTSWNLNVLGVGGPNPVGNGVTATNGSVYYTGSGNWVSTGISNIDYVFHFNNNYYGVTNTSSQWRSPDTGTVNFTAITSNILDFGGGFLDGFAASPTRVISYQHLQGSPDRYLKTFYSDNGTTWVDGGVIPGFTFPAGVQFQVSVGYVNGSFFLAAGITSYVSPMRFYKSPDGINWTEISLLAGSITTITPIII